MSLAKAFSSARRPDPNANGTTFKRHRAECLFYGPQLQRWGDGSVQPSAINGGKPGGSTIRQVVDGERQKETVWWARSVAVDVGFGDVDANDAWPRLLARSR